MGKLTNGITVKSPVGAGAQAEEDAVVEVRVFLLIYRRFP
jgi:hypothetical protein